MPTYEYECESCGHEFELFQKMTDPPCETCPKCKSGVRKKIGAGAGLIFKGSGFYITDYRSDAYKKQAQAEGNSGSTSSGSGKSKSDESSSSKSESSTGSGSKDKTSGKSGGTKAAE
jgi:putative FmdB family regulatory protein